MNIEISPAILFNVFIIFAASQYFLFHYFRKTVSLQDKKIKSLKNDIQALLLCSRGVGERLHEQQSEFKFIRDRQDKLELNDGMENVPYQQVMALLERGVTANEMASSCDLTQGEVELLAHLQKKQQNSKLKRPVLAA